MLMLHKGVAYNNHVISFEEFAQVKATLPSGQVPTWQEPQGGKVLNQMTAILRMLGRRHGYYFDDNADEAFNVDWVLETHADFWNSKTYLMWLKGESDSAKITEGIAKLAAFNKQMEAHLASQNSKFLASDRLTIADFVVFSLYMTLF